jgi:hypothetical protein
MSSPGCRLSSEIPSATLPSIRVELLHPNGSSSVPETTNLRTPFMKSTIGVPPGWLGQKAAIPLYVTRPISNASDAAIPKALASSISSLE